MQEGEITQDMSQSLAAIIDHTLLKPDSTEQQVRQLCAEAIKYQFYSVCILPMYVQLAASLLEGSDIAVCTVIGFPLGAINSSSKAHETTVAIEQGASELDMVLNVSAMKSGNTTLVEEDIRAVVNAASGNIVKVILETCLLEDSEKKLACELVMSAGADFVKTSTGFSHGGATREDVELMRSVVGQDFGVKASGGIRDVETAKMMVQAGANRLGTSSGIAIVTSADSDDRADY